MAIIEILQYAFLQRAFLAGSLVAITCASLGIFLVLRQMSLIGDGLAHVSFGMIALGLFLGIYPFYLAVPLVMLASVLILKISQKAGLYADAAIGIVSAAGIASGVILASLARGFNVALFSYLFGSILAINPSEAILSVVVSLLVLFLLVFFYWDLLAVTFDENYAKTLGVKTNVLNYLLTLLTGVVVVLSIKVVGVMLVSALLVLPAVTALQFSARFKTAILLSIFFAFVSVNLGILFSYFFDLPSGAMVVLLNLIFFMIGLTYKKVGLN